MTPDTPTPTVTLAEFTPAAVPAVAPAAIHTVEEAAAALSAQYRYAVDGLYEAYRFGLILLVVKRYLEWKEEGGSEVEGAARPLDPAPAQGAGPRPAPVGAGVEAPITENQILVCESARGPAKIEDELRGGWNRGTGLKAWLARYCPEINYSTAKRFLAVAERTHAALMAASDPQAPGASPSDSSSTQSDWGPAPCAGAGEGARSPFPPEAPSEAGTPFAIPTFPEATVRAFLAGKSQRAVLRLGGKREGAGRKAKDWVAALEASPEVAWKELAEPLERLSRLIVRQRRHAVLTPTDLHTLRDAIDLLHEVIHADA